MMLMIHGGEVTSGNRTLYYNRSEDGWKVTKYVNKYETRTLCDGVDIKTAIKIFRDK